MAPGRRMRSTLARAPLALERVLERENFENEAEVARDGNGYVPLCA